MTELRRPRRFHAAAAVGVFVAVFAALLGGWEPGPLFVADLPAPVEGAAFSGDGRSLVTFCRVDLPRPVPGRSQSGWGLLQVWNLASGRPVRQFAEHPDHGGWVKPPEYGSFDPETFVVNRDATAVALVGDRDPASRDAPQVQVLTLLDQRVHTLPIRSEARPYLRLSFHPDRPLLRTLCGLEWSGSTWSDRVQRQSLRVWDTATGRESAAWEGVSTSRAAASRDGRTVAVAVPDGGGRAVCLLDGETLRERSRFPVGPDRVTDLRLTDDGRGVVALRHPPDSLLQGFWEVWDSGGRRAVRFPVEATAIEGWDPATGLPLPSCRFDEVSGRFTATDPVTGAVLAEMPVRTGAGEQWPEPSRFRVAGGVAFALSDAPARPPRPWWAAWLARVAPRLAAGPERPEHTLWAFDVRSGTELLRGAVRQQVRSALVVGQGGRTVALTRPAWGVEVWAVPARPPYLRFAAVALCVSAAVFATRPALRSVRNRLGRRAMRTSAREGDAP